MSCSQLTTTHNTVVAVGYLVPIESTNSGNKKLLAPAIASASPLDLANLARTTPADKKETRVPWEQDLGFDTKCVPHLQATWACTSCSSFVGLDVQTKFLN